MAGGFLAGKFANRNANFAGTPEPTPAPAPVAPPAAVAPPVQPAPAPPPAPAAPADPAPTPTGRPGRPRGNRAPAAAPAPTPAPAAAPTNVTTVVNEAAPAGPTFSITVSNLGPEDARDLAGVLAELFGVPPAQ